MAHKKAAGSAKNLRDSNPKYRGVKVFGGQPVTAGDIIIRQKGDKYKLGANVYKGRDYTIHAGADGVVSFGKKKYTRFDGKIYLKTYVEVLQHQEAATTAPAKATAKKTPAKKVSAKKTEAKAPAAKATTSATDLSSLTVKELKEKAKELGLSGYSTMKKGDLVALITQSS